MDDYIQIMNRFLFRFGYCTPAQWAANNAHGWDDESSGAFFVQAESDAAALIAGAEVVEQFVRSLFVEANVREIPSWKASKFAFWIEENPSQSFSKEALRELPEVSPGETPDFTRWIC